MKRILLAAMLVAILMPVVAEAGPLRKLAGRGKAAVGKVGGAVRGVCGRLGCG
jgi:hypothetical protein